MKSNPSRSNDFNKMLAVYSATAGAALLAAPAAHATIQNITGLSGVTVDLSPNAGFQAKIFTAGPLYGSLGGTRSTGPGAGSVRSTHYHRLRAGICACTQAAILATGSTARLFHAGDSIARKTGTTAQYYGILRRQSTSGGTTARTAGRFVPPAGGAFTGYIGFKAVQNSQTYYGWLRVRLAADSQGIVDQISLVDKNNDNIYGAFGLTSDDIKAGQVLPVPEPSIASIGGLGLLALGAAGVRELRRRKQLKMQEPR